MEESQDSQFATLANLRSELKKVEKAANLEYENLCLKQDREVLLNRVQRYQHSRFELGRALWNYRGHFKVEHVWVEAAKLIGAAVGRSERTVYRIISVYERASNLPETVVDALVERNIDPAAGKNVELVDNLLQMPRPETRQEAATAVTEAFEKHSARKRLAKKKKAAKSEKASVEEFAAHIVKQFEGRYRSAAPDVRDAEVRYVLERVVNTLRAEIRELRRFGRPALVPGPAVREAA